jgi:hypothetical protein
MSLKAKALEGVLERVQGGTASRGKALIAAIGAGVVVYRLLRSGSPGGDEGEDADDGAGGGDDGDGGGERGEPSSGG